MIRNSVKVFLVASVCVPVLAMIGCLIWILVHGDSSDQIRAGTGLWLMAVGSGILYLVATQKPSKFDNW